MRRRALLVPLTAALAVLALAAGAARSDDNPVLDAIVGTNDSFEATFKAGMRYAYACYRSSRHDFRLLGRGVNRSTGRAFTGVATWNVRLARGSYTYRSDLARSKRRLRVG